MSGNGVRELAGAVDEIRDRTNAVTEEAKAARERLATLGTVIAEAVATGDAGLTQELRSERGDLECVVRDAEAAERLLSRKLEGAQRDLAAARLPEVQREAETARDELEQIAEQSRTAVQAFLKARRVFLETRNRAARAGDGRPSGDIQPRSRIASVIIGAIQDFGAQ